MYNQRRNVFRRSYGPNSDRGTCITCKHPFQAHEGKAAKDNGVPTEWVCNWKECECHCYVSNYSKCAYCDHALNLHGKAKDPGEPRADADGFNQVCRGFSTPCPCGCPGFHTKTTDEDVMVQDVFEGLFILNVFHSKEFFLHQEKTAASNPT